MVAKVIQFPRSDEEVFECDCGGQAFMLYCDGGCQCLSCAEYMPTLAVFEEIDFEPDTDPSHPAA